MNAYFNLMESAASTRNVGIFNTYFYPSLMGTRERDLKAAKRHAQATVKGDITEVSKTLSRAYISVSLN